jgi:hypothetical protein
MTEWMETIATRAEVLALCAVFFAVIVLMIEIKLDKIVTDYLKDVTEYLKEKDKQK